MLGGLTVQAGYWEVFWPRLIQGFGLGIPVRSAHDDRARRRTDRTNLRARPASITLLRQLGGSFGIAILTTMLTHQTAVAWNVLASGVTQTHGYSVPALTGMVAQQSSMIAYDYLFRFCAIVFVVATPLVFFISRNKRASKTSGVPAEAA